jgi:hypothetical protein
MTSLFDGLATVLVDIFGQPVAITRGSAAPVTVMAVLREEPDEIPGADGRPVFAVIPILQIPSNAEIIPQKGDRVAAGGKVYAVLSAAKRASPASDRMLVCELEALP